MKKKKEKQKKRGRERGRKGAHRECTVKGRVLTTSVGRPVDITAPASQHLERRRLKGQRDSHI